jgi:AcrR family transcriptional regulator
LALIEAALDCMAQDGMAGFTVDRVCTRACVSRGLVTHHFGGMAGLLAACYAHLYAKAVPSEARLTQGPSRLLALLDALFDPSQFNRPALNVWLTMWGAISNTPELMEEHRRQYADYVDLVAAILGEQGPLDDAKALARRFICLVDGLSLQHCIDPPSMPAAVARQAALDFVQQNAQLFKVG